MATVTLEGLQCGAELHVGGTALFMEATDETGTALAVKFRQVAPSALPDEDDTEAKVLLTMADTPGFPRLVRSEAHPAFRVLVMTRLGPSLADLLGYCGGRFSLKTVLLLTDQMLGLLQALHEAGFVHGQLTPGHFLIGRGDFRDVLHLVDFTRASRPEGKGPAPRAPPPQDLDFASIGAMKGQRPAWRDDLQSLAFILLHLLRGSLPWDEKVAALRAAMRPADALSPPAERAVAALRAALTAEKQCMPAELLCLGLPGDLTSPLRPAYNLRKVPIGL